jgi:hypothetical protein
MRVSVALTVTASGDMLAPLFVFKGKPGGRIEREFTNYEPGGIYYVQDKAWMDQSIIMKWIENVLKLYVLTAPAGIQPVLFLGSYRCHMMSSVVGAIENMGVQVEHIPGGCTGLYQPIDVAIGKPVQQLSLDNKRKSWLHGPHSACDRTGAVFGRGLLSKVHIVPEAPFNLFSISQCMEQGWTLGGDKEKVSGW